MLCAESRCMLWNIPETWQVWIGTLSMPFCQQWHCCFFSQETEGKNCLWVAETRAWRFQIPESCNPISRWQFCDLSQRISRILSRADCCTCSKKRKWLESSGDVYIKLGLASSNHKKKHQSVWPIRAEQMSVWPATPTSCPTPVCRNKSLIPYPL